MAGNEAANVISLRESQPANVSEQVPNISVDSERSGIQQDLDRKRAFALAGSALSQLPIWGT
jgi:hypothetical protein